MAAPDVRPPDRGKLAREPVVLNTRALSSHGRAASSNGGTAAPDN